MTIYFVLLDFRGAILFLALVRISSGQTKLVWDFPRLLGSDTLIKFIYLSIYLNHAAMQQ